MRSYGAAGDESATFWRLGLTLARRGLRRDILAVLSLAVSTVALAFGGFGIGAGKPGTAAVAVRRFLGGDVLVQVPAEAAPGVSPPRGAAWAWAFADLDRLGPLSLFDPSLPWSGAASATGTDAASVAAVLPSVPGVAQVIPFLSLPALWQYAPGKYARVEVLARDTRDDIATGFAMDDITAGRYFTAAQADAAVALVDGFRAGHLIAWMDGTPQDLAAPVPAVGSTIALSLPAWHAGAADWSQLTAVGLAVVGQYQVPDGSWDWQSQQLTPSGPKTIPPTPINPSPLRLDQADEPADWATGAVLVPAGYWSALARQVGWTPSPGQGAWILRLAGGLAAQSQVISTLQARLPGASVVALSTLAEPTRPARDPAVAVPVTDAQAVRAQPAALQTAVPGEPGWVAQAVAAMLEVIALLVFVGNLYVVLVNRREEIAGLRAIGASLGQIVAMLGAELCAVTLAGVAAGFVLSAPALVWQQASNGAGLVGVAASLGHLAAIVLAGALPLAGVVLGLAAVWAARLPVMSVLRGG